MFISSFGSALLMIKTFCVGLSIGKISSPIMPLRIVDFPTSFEPKNGIKISFFISKSFNSE